MSTLRSLVSRFTGNDTESAAGTSKPAAALPRLPNPFKRDWRKRMQNIDNHISEARAELTELERQRAHAALREQEGEEGASKELASIRKKITTVHDRIGDLQAAHGAARDKVLTEIADAEAQARKEQAATIRKAQKKLAAAVEKADAALDTAASELDTAADAAAELHRAAGSSTVAQVVHEQLLGRVAESVNFRFRRFGLKPGPFVAVESVPLMQYVPPADYLIENARPPVFQRPTFEPDGEDDTTPEAAAHA